MAKTPFLRVCRYSCINVDATSLLKSSVTLTGEDREVALKQLPALSKMPIPPAAGKGKEGTSGEGELLCMCGCFYSQRKQRKTSRAQEFPCKCSAAGSSVNKALVPSKPESMWLRRVSVARWGLGSLPRCTWCSPCRSRSGTARSWSSANQGAEAAKASCGQRGHRADSRRSWVRRQQVRDRRSCPCPFNALDGIVLTIRPGVQGGVASK